MEFQVYYGGSEHTAAAGLDALTVYEQEFHSDLIKDVYGIVDVTESDLEGAVTRAGAADDVILTIDFTKTNWTAVLRAVWACLRSKDSHIPSFATWSKQTEGLNLRDMNEAAIPAFEEGFFPSRSGDAGKEADSADQGE